MDAPKYSFAVVRRTAGGANLGKPGFPVLGGEEGLTRLHGAVAAQIVSIRMYHTDEEVDKPLEVAS
jgi:hypothetical protein